MRPGMRFPSWLLLAAWLGLLAAPAMLGGCAPREVAVPVEITRALPEAPAECRNPLPEDLPRPRELAGAAASAEQVNAHWAAHWLRARQVYRREARDPARLCQRYVAQLHATQPR